MFFSNKTKENYVLFTDTEQYHFYKIKADINVIFVTMVAGGGAGGIGFIDNHYYYAGGGGGAGSCMIGVPLDVKKGAILKIRVGKGGNSASNIDGQNSTVEVLNGDEVETTLTAYGGKNGKPNRESNGLFVKKLEGGKGGNTDLASFTKGNNGENGNISIPSQSPAVAGSGGSSAFSVGGKGGGFKGFEHNLIGSDGKFGSGGGGSCPRVVIDTSKKVSGSGGDGMVKIEW